MNFFEGIVEEDAINVGFAKIPFKNISNKLVGKRVVVGIRPSDISVIPIANSVQVKGTTILVENLGSEYILHIDVGGVILRAISKTKPTSSEVILYLDKSKLHVFSEDETRVDF